MNIIKIRIKTEFWNFNHILYSTSAFTVYTDHQVQYITLQNKKQTNKPKTNKQTNKKQQQQTTQCIV